MNLLLFYLWDFLNFKNTWNHTVYCHKWQVSFLLLNNIPVFACTLSYPFIYGYLDCFHILSYISRAIFHFLTVTPPIYNPATNAWGIFFFHIPDICFSLTFCNSHDDTSEVLFCRFDLYFSVDYWCWASFHLAVGHLLSLLEKFLFMSSAHILMELFNFFVIEMWYEFLTYFGY